MYYDQRGFGSGGTRRMYDPGDIKKISWDVGMHGADVGKEMAKAGEALDAQDAQAMQERNMGMQQSMYQAAHERNLQAAEQQRRAYDSQTARQTALDNQARKYSVLGDLLRNRPTV